MDDQHLYPQLNDRMAQAQAQEWGWDSCNLYIQMNPHAPPCFLPKSVNRLQFHNFCLFFPSHSHSHSSSLVLIIHLFLNNHKIKIHKKKVSSYLITCFSPFFLSCNQLRTKYIIIIIIKLQSHCIQLWKYSFNT